MPAPNCEKIIDGCFDRMILKSFGTDGLKEATSEDRRNFRRSEAEDCKTERGVAGAITQADLAGYLTAKYPPTDVDVDDPKENTEDDAESAELVIIITPGGIQENTFPKFKEMWDRKLESVDLSPRTEGGFKELKKFCKACEGAEVLVNNVLEDVMNGDAEAEQLFISVKDMLSTIKGTRIKANRAIKTHNDKVKQDGITAAEEAVKSYVDKQRVNHAELAGIPLCDRLSLITKAAAKKQKVSTMSAAVNAAVITLEADVDNKVAHCRAMITLIDESGFKELYPDKKELCQKDRAVVEAEVSARLAKRELAETKRIEAARVKKEADEAAAAKVKANAEAKNKEKVDSEAKATEPPTSHDTLALYSLSDFKKEAEEKKHPRHVENWRKKHNNRICTNLYSDEISLLDAFIVNLINDMRGTPPPHEDPPDVSAKTESAAVEEHVPEEPESERMRVFFNINCTPSQLENFASKLRGFISENPFVDSESVSIVTI
jgi:hypothetical protein